MKMVAALVLFFIAFMCFMIDLVGMHGHLMFRPHMTEDWITWGIAAVSLLSGLVLFIRAIQGQKSFKQRQVGAAKGFFTMRNDFDEPLEDFKEYM